MLRKPAPPNRANVVRLLARNQGSAVYPQVRGEEPIGKADRLDIFLQSPFRQIPGSQRTIHLHVRRLEPLHLRRSSIYIRHLHRIPSLEEAGRNGGLELGTLSVKRHRNFALSHRK